ncbi:endonuclease domain-containing protein [Microbacterium hominis]|uniref:endonuclease domain-containing protein n=1 Tax=Microbacterium hominis TaxID=162426 RepID=UPI0007687506|nr:DUF559 domain-containing protein [Microbacterium hominis]KXC07285.1 DNA/RNA helicase [Microbacterium hominis]
MGIEDDVRGAGGIVRVRRLRERGWSERQLRAAVETRRLSRPRKGWVALPDADPHLTAAARAGVVISCVTQAERLGLWLLERTAQPHVAASPRSGAVRAPRAHVHWAQPIVPRHPDALVDEIENVLALVAQCLPFEEALIVWESALDHKLVTLDELRRLPFRGAARELLDRASPYSGSGLETLFIARLSWLGVPIVPQVWIAGHRVDFLIGARLVFQIDGGTHVGAQRTSDIAHDAELMLLGYHVIRVGYAQVVHRWHEVQALVMRAVAQGLHIAR